MDSARHATWIAWLLLTSPCQRSFKNYRVRGKAVSRENGPLGSLILLFTSFLSASLARQCFFYALSFARFQVKRVTFYFFDNVLGLYLPFEAAKCVFEGFSLLKSYFCQLDYTPLLVLTGPVSYGKPPHDKSRGMCRNFPSPLEAPSQ